MRLQWMPKNWRKSKRKSRRTFRLLTISSGSRRNLKKSKIPPPSTKTISKMKKTKIQWRTSTFKNVKIGPYSHQSTRYSHQSTRIKNNSTTSKTSNRNSLNCPNQTFYPKINCKLKLNPKRQKPRGKNLLRNLTSPKALRRTANVRKSNKLRTNHMRREFRAAVKVKSRNKVHQWIKTGRIPQLKAKRRIRFKVISQGKPT